MGMGWLVTKYLTTAFVVVLVSEIAKRSDKLCPWSPFLRLSGFRSKPAPLRKFPTTLGTHFGM